MNRTPEIWKDIPGYEGFYSASNLGRIRSLPRRVPYAGGSDRNLKGRIIRVHYNHAGYGRVDLCVNGLRRPEMVHLLIARTFIGPRPAGLDACHNDGDQKNNATENLRYDTKAANEADKVGHGTSNRGERCGTSKLTAGQVIQIRELYATHAFTQEDLASQFGVGRRSIGRAISGDRWGWL